MNSICKLNFKIRALQNPIILGKMAAYFSNGVTVTIPTNLDKVSHFLIRQWFTWLLWKIRSLCYVRPCLCALFSLLWKVLILWWLSMPLRPRQALPFVWFLTHILTKGILFLFPTIKGVMLNDAVRVKTSLLSTGNQTALPFWSASRSFHRLSWHWNLLSHNKIWPDFIIFLFLNVVHAYTQLMNHDWKQNTI